MSGLLDKAKSASTPEEKPAEKKAETATLLSSKVKSTNSNATTVVVQQDGPDIPMILNIAGWVIIVLGAIFSLQGGGFGLIVVLVVLALGIGSIVQSQRMSGGISPVTVSYTHLRAHETV